MSLIEKLIREMNLDIDRVTKLFFTHKCDFLYRLGLDGILVSFWRSSLNKSPSEPYDINKIWLIRVSGGNSSVLQIRVRNRKLFFLFLNQKICWRTQNNHLDDTVLLSTQNTRLN